MGGHYVGHEWFEEGKVCAQSLHRLSLELVEDAGIPGRSFSLPADFLGALDAYENAVQDLQELNDGQGRGVHDGGPRSNTL